MPGTKEKANFMKANGTAKSILSWSKGAKLDKRQCRAFMILTAQFVLTFYEDNSDDTLGGSDQSASNKEKQRLKTLIKLKSGQRSIDKLVMMLHGPGGSGKSTVINLLREYAKEFCNLLKVPFTKQTIVTTAMSGVAATLLFGETMHRACDLCRKVTQNDVDSWKNSRMLIIDEISFASIGDLLKLQQKLQVILEKNDKLFA